ncbi:TPA: ArsR family transcriptional regulator [Clostridium botulinum]|nr:ArsR family transcriptional regulator [Clostridium botulinum]
MCSTIFTENDYRILKAIIDRNDTKKGLCKGNGTTVKEIIEKTELSDKKVRQTLKKFEKLGFIDKGLKIIRADTFMLTKKGFEELNSLRVNIFGEV